LNVISINIPPLRDRCEDIPEFVGWFLKSLNKVCNTSVTCVHPAVIEAFIRYPWPGNLRELENAVEHALNLTDGDELRLEHIPPHIWQHAIENADKNDTACSRDLDDSLAKYEHDLIIAALRATGNNRSKAARLLNISRSGLYKKLQKYDIAKDGTARRLTE
jgi:two-component system response regulator AtoC